LCFADHLAGEEAFARRIPVLAAAVGCRYIEKHVCISRENTEFDAFSSLEPSELEEMLTEISQCVESLSAQFVGDSERKYLADTLQAPVLLQGLRGGQVVAQRDVIYRRTDQKGLAWKEIDRLQRNRRLLSDDVRPQSTLREKDFRPARIAVIVACRMKSSRLKNKAILPIRGMASVERCLSNCLLFPHAHSVILATSDLEEDRQLEDYTLGGRVKFWRGDADDVIRRYLGACEAYDIDVVIRVTADCPVVSPEIAAVLLERHFATGADYTAPRAYAVGSNSEIYNVEALKRVIHYLKRADYSEYMTWYMQNNVDIFKVNLVDLPKDLVRDYRLTLDYQEDLEMLERLYTELENRQLEPTLRNVFEILDSHQEIVRLNKDMEVCYRTDQELINTLNRVTRIHGRKGDSPNVN
jgi:N,N'-diacetyllegionaminate synthase